MQEQALECGLPSLPHHEAEQPDCPVRRPSRLSTATRPHRSAGGQKIPSSCVYAGAGAGVWAGAGPCVWGASVAWCSRPGGAGHGSLTLSRPGSSGPGHHILLVTETHCTPVPRLRTHGDGCAPGTTGGEPRSLTACWHRWRCCTGWVPHSHGLGRWWQVEGSQGALSASLPWDLPGKVPGCSAAAPLVLGARRAHHRTGPSKGRGGVLGRGQQVAVWPPGVAHNCTAVHGAVLA